MRAYVCGENIHATRLAFKVVGNAKLDRGMDKTCSPGAGHQPH
jgi:hypothetical protein